jgi:uncharacterized RDD family membrane protein YckC
VAGQRDPHAIITPESFAVAPELLGLPLARPGRRLLALLFDLIPVAILANAGFRVFLAFLLAVLAWRALSPRIQAGQARKGVAVPVRVAASLAVLVLVLAVSGRLRGSGGGDEDQGDNAQADSAQIAARIIEQAVLSGMGLGNLDLRTVEEAPSGQRDTVVLRYADAIARGDEPAADSLRPLAIAALDGPRIRELLSENSRLEMARDSLEEATRKPANGVMAWISSIADDLGIGFGWSALYFTFFLVIGRGQTPGKRLLGIRVIRLDARPLNWWLAFERFGGYFASLSTGLLGFLQIFWDRNRQALHDKAVETVVIRVTPDAATARPHVRR